MVFLPRTVGAVDAVLTVATSAGDIRYRVQVRRYIQVAVSLLRHAAVARSDPLLRVLVCHGFAVEEVGANCVCVQLGWKTIIPGPCRPVAFAGLKKN